MDTNQMLLGILAARAGLPAGLPAEEVMARLTEARPELALFRQLLEQREAAAAAEQDDDDWDLVEEDDSTRSEVVDALRSVLDMLARALGACSACWGRDPSCAECGGRGVPGFLSPHPDLFREIVLPAARRWQADLRASGRFTSRSGHHPEERN
jgi:hypothetical protein